jgi:hypothetical protein
MKVVHCCGEPLECSGFTNTCPTCGADYNWTGQRLAPRSQWGEETGESLADIMSVAYMFDNQGEFLDDE